jgi:hypothetical protein
LQRSGSSSRPRPLEPPPYSRLAAEAAGGPKASWVKTRLPGALPLPTISRSDEEFARLGVEFLTTSDGIRVYELIELFDKVGGGALPGA